MKVLICYAYCENQKGILANNESMSNLNFFLNNAIIQNDDYLFCININGQYSFNFEYYIQKYPNLKIIKSNGTCQLDAYLNIFNNFNLNNYNFYFLFSDKVRGPYHKINNWVDYYTSQLIKYPVIISAYGTSPFSKLYKLPYIAMKFMCFNKRILDLFIKNNFFINNRYNTIDINSHNNPNNILEIKMSCFLLDNNINYVVLDNNGITDLNVLKYYKEKNWNKLFEITKELHRINDTTTENRIFWTGYTMKKIFEDKDSKIIKKLKKPRDTSKLDRWY